MMLWHLFTAQRSVFYTVALITAVAVAVELAYFEIDALGGRTEPSSGSD